MTGQTRAKGLTRRTAAAALLLAGAILPHQSQAADFVPAIVYATGAKFDKSFNEGAYNGAERFKAETGIAYLEYQPQNPAEFERGVTALIRRGATQVAAIGFYYATPIKDLAPKHPGVRFTLIDAVVDLPNVESITYKENEGAFLAGMLAAMASKSGRIGFIGAIDIPLIRKFSTGYEYGAHYVRPDAQVLLNFVGVTPAAFNDPTTASEVARSQLIRGADVLFAGAGLSNIGIFDAAKAQGDLAIGVDANQNGLYPGTILTSQLKNVDTAVYESFMAGREGFWRGGTRELGLKENGVGIVFDQYNAPLVTDDMRARIETARNAIIDGQIVVPAHP